MYTHSTIIYITGFVLLFGSFCLLNNNEAMETCQKIQSYETCFHTLNR